jgi:RHS repeat-associated protein
MTILERRSYDAFGARRNPDWTQKTLSSASRGTTVGYTGHEDDDDLGLVNMKGRILDPRLARFLTTDPIVARPGFSQSWNPYSYVLNSPLKYVDPTGFEPDPELVKIYGPGVEDTIEVIGARIPDRDPSVDGRPPRDSDEVNRAGNKDSGAPQAYDYANPGQSGPNAGYMGFDPDPDVREQQNDEIQRNLTGGARGLGEIVLGGATESPALVRKGAMRYAEATGIVDPRTVQVILGVYQWLSAGAGTQPANAAPTPGSGSGTANARPALEGDPWSPAEVAGREGTMAQPNGPLAAQALGYNQRISPQKSPFLSHGAEVYSNGKNYITPDVDVHSGGVWKMFDRRGNRVGTYDADLNRIKD